MTGGVTANDDYSIPVGSTSVQSTSFVCELDDPLPQTIHPGAGGIVVVSGSCFHNTQFIEQVYVTTDESITHSQDTEMYQLEPHIGTGMRFWFEIPIAEIAEGQVSLGLQVRVSGGNPITVDLGTVPIRSDTNLKRVDAKVDDHLPLITVCMATYRPETKSLDRQIESIRAQTYQKWRCIISDDGSGEHYIKVIREMCAGDDRFEILENDRNRGFYGNFERVLEHVSADTAYVALCDQDDKWYPDKLQRLLQGFESDTTLVYSDMRIVDATNDEIISDTYWSKRNNNYTDLTVLLIANTITGAASLFRANLLPYLLPFPKKVGDTFHDHWIGCVALSVGNIRYIDSPLYDYYQYSQNVIGHCDFDRLNIRERGKILGAWLRKLGSPSVFKASAIRSWLSSLAVYKYECRRIRIISKTIKARIEVSDPKKRKALHIFGDGLSPGIKLLISHLKILVRKQTTDDAELRLAAGYIVWWINRRREQKRLRKWKTDRVGT